MSSFRVALVPLALAAFPAAAHAQTDPVISVVHADGSSNSTSIAGVWYVNAADCAAPTTATVRVSTSGSTTSFGDRPQVWIGTNCDQSTARSGTNATCMQAQTSGTVTRDGTAYIFPLAALVPAAGATNSSTYDLCNSASQGSKRIFLMPETLLTGDPQPTIAFSLTSDLTAPSAVSVTTTNPSGDNSVTFAWDSSTTLAANDVVYFFAQPGGCGSIGLDAGVSDLGVADGGTGDAAVATGFAPGLRPPVDDPAFLDGATGSGDSASIDSSSLGLAAYGDTVAVGFAVRDAAGNYGVLSNIVCATRVQTFGLCDVEGDCPQGGCSVSSDAPERGDAIVASLAVLAGLAVWRRRR